MKRSYYSDNIAEFISKDKDSILGKLTRRSQFDVKQPQLMAWQEEIKIMKETLTQYCGRGSVYFEYEIPRLGRRIDVLAVIDNVIFVIEFKVNAEEFSLSAMDQVCDYALDMKNFHETSRTVTVAPILVATKAKNECFVVKQTEQEDKLLSTIRVNTKTLADAISKTLSFASDDNIDVNKWEHGRYSPTPTIIEAATALYKGNSVREISRHDAGATNLNKTSETIASIIQSTKDNSRKSICFVTGVPGAGKTLVGLDIATRHMDENSELYSVFLSGNGPLVNVLREALTRDKVRRNEETSDAKIKVGTARNEVDAFIQNVHKFRDDCIVDKENPPIEHVVLFDEAQRAWNKQQTVNFMRRRKGIPDFDQSEPEFLISCMNRHTDWATIVCLVGGGQEIKTGEAGISEWISAIASKFKEWHVYVSPRLTDSEYNADQAFSCLKKHPNVEYMSDLHLSVSMRSFRDENVSLLVKQLLDLETDQAKKTLGRISEKYPIVLTRDLRQAKKWLRRQARGSERYGMVVSSQAERLKPHAIDVRPRVNPVHWFLGSKEDVRSSYYLEDVVTEFEIQGLEIDWACLTWDADFRHMPQGWEHWSFRGKRWNHIHKPENKNYLKNAYRVLLTRARQGMVIVVPEGDRHDPTRANSYYDQTFDYLRGIGFKLLPE